MYHLGKPYPGIYFTQREVECLVHLLDGCTMVGVAKILRLSPRTVEFYVKNMRMKVGAATKLELLLIMERIGFTKDLNHQLIARSQLIPNDLKRP
jgi:DNA-binding CsgD family transcriptional regulator